MGSEMQNVVKLPGLYFILGLTETVTPLGWRQINFMH